MKVNRETLIFPDTSSLADFILDQKISNAEVNSDMNSLTAPLTIEQKAMACTQYSAILEEKRIWISDEE